MGEKKRKRRVLTLTGEAMRLYEQWEEQYPEKSATEILETISDRLQDPEDLALMKWDEFRQKAQQAFGMEVIKIIGVVDSILTAIRAGNLDAEVAHEELRGAHQRMLQEPQAEGVSVSLGEPKDNGDSG